MASLTDRKFWINLFQKVIKIILKNKGISTAPKTNNQHVVPHEEGWAVKGAGNERYTEIFRTQSEAIERAKEIARNYKSDVIIHKKDGQIRDRYSYD